MVVPEIQAISIVFKLHNKCRFNMAGPYEVRINRFDGGMADDYVLGSEGQNSISKQFDLFSYPFRLQPLRGMEDRTEAVDTGILNMILGQNGIMYGIGLDNPGNPTFGELYNLTGYGSSDVWDVGGIAQLSGAANSEASGHFDFLVHFPEMSAARKVFWSSANLLVASSPDMDISGDTQALTFSTIGQGYVHPKDKILYFPYQTSTATILGSIASHTSDSFGNFTASAFTGVSSRYRAYCLSHYGDYLAIPMTVSGVPSTKSIVGLWDRDTTNNLFTETIPWGAGDLKVLNNLNGALIGITVLSGEVSAAAQDVDKIQVKVYEGGAGPQVIKEITATRLTSTAPACVLNHRVNFIHNNRLYFSANIINGNANANYYGLWSVGRNKLGQWTVILERVATNDNTETGVLAAAMYGDFLTCTHTSGGTITYTLNGNNLNSIYDATSAYETTLNPQMPEEHKMRRKVLRSVFATYLPLPADAQVVLKYRLDALKSTNWTTAFTETTDSKIRTEKTHNADGKVFGEFDNLELRVESTDGAIITGIGYVYDILKSPR